MLDLIKNIFLFLSFILISTLFTHADGALQMKGFHHDLPLKEACHIMSSFNSERGDFIFKEKEKKCGFGRHGFITYPCIIGKKDSTMVDSIILSPDVVDTLFNAQDKKAKTFVRSFLHEYQWIDTFRTKGIYRQKSKKYGWALMINQKKWIKISFFERTERKKEKSKSEKMLKTIPVY